MLEVYLDGYKPRAGSQELSFIYLHGKIEQNNDNSDIVYVDDVAEFDKLEDGIYPIRCERRRRGKPAYYYGTLYFWRTDSIYPRRGLIVALDDDNGNAAALRKFKERTDTL